MGHIKREHLQEALVVIPPPTVLREADSIVGPIYERLATLRIENRKLAMLRQELLPKLISGDVPVHRSGTRNGD